MGRDSMPACRLDCFLVVNRNLMPLKMFGILLVLLLPLIASTGFPGPEPVAHRLKGRIISLGSGNDVSRIEIALLKKDETLIGKQVPGYDGTFLFEKILPGDYLVTISGADRATLVRPVRVQEYPTPKVIFLDIRLSADGAANIRELVQEYSRDASSSLQEKSSTVNKKAQQELSRASQESERGNYANAIEHLQKAIQEAPNFYEAYNNLGAQYQKLKQYDAAIQSFQKAIALRPDSLRPHINLGMVYWSMGQLDKAIPEFQEAIKYDSTSVSAYLALGRLFLQKKQYHLAEPSLETATRLNPKESRQGFLDLIQIQLIHNDTGKARFFLNRFFEFFPGDPDGLTLQKKIEVQASPAQKTLP